jgi:hypothetical protein
VVSGGGACTVSFGGDELFVDIGPVGWAVFALEGS